MRFVHLRVNGRPLCEIPELVDSPLPCTIPPKLISIVLKKIEGIKPNADVDVMDGLCPYSIVSFNDAGKVVNIGEGRYRLS